jgi:hypothetical protein
MGETYTCQAGQYINAGQTGCDECTAGKFCADGVDESNRDGTKVSLGSATEMVDCPAGFKCDSGDSWTGCATGEYSTVTSASCTEADYIIAEDLSGASCGTVTSSYEGTGNQYQCTFSSLDNSASGTA